VQGAELLRALGAERQERAGDDRGRPRPRPVANQGEGGEERAREGEQQRRLVAEDRIAGGEPNGA
jgi:hypothetical protein